MSGSISDDEYLTTEDTKPITVEDIVISDAEDDTAETDVKISIDINSRVNRDFRLTTHQRPKVDKDDCTTQLHHSNIDFHSIYETKFDSVSSYDELEISDTETNTVSPLNVDFIDAGSHVAVKCGFPVIQSSKKKKCFNDSLVDAVNSSDSCSREFMAEASTANTLIYRKGGKKRMFDFYQACIEQTQSDTKSLVCDVKGEKEVSSDERFLLSEEDDDDVFVNDDGGNSKLPRVPSAQLEFIDMNSDEDSETDDEGLATLNQTKNVESSATRKIYCDDKEKSHAMKVDSNSRVDQEGKFSKINYMRHCQQQDDNGSDLTEEEELCYGTGMPETLKCKASSGKEWTETDASGGVTQITQIKTETSIKVGGDEGESGEDDDLLSRTTTTTTTRIITTVTTGGDDGTTEETQGTDELRSSMEAVLSQFMSEDTPSQEQSSKPE